MEIIDEQYVWDLEKLEQVHAWLAGDDADKDFGLIASYKEIVFSPEADEIQSIAATELGATA